MKAKTIEDYRKNYVEMKLLARGQYGVVYLVHQKDKQNELRICKQIRLSLLKEKEVASCLQEFDLLMVLKHPNVVLVHENYIDKENSFIIMEYCQSTVYIQKTLIEGDLSMQISTRKQAQDKQGFPQQIIYNWLIQLLMALQYIHTRNVIHRDLKPSNIFVDNNVGIKIGDFGVSKIVSSSNQFAQTLIGSPYFLSPEACKGEPYTQKSDIWAMGCIIHELCTLEHLFQGGTLTEVTENIIKGKQQRQINKAYGDDFIQVVNLMLIPDQEKRPSARELLSQPFIIKLFQEIYSPKTFLKPKQDEKKQQNQIKAPSTPQLNQQNKTTLKKNQDNKKTHDIQETPTKPKSQLPPRSQGNQQQVEQVQKRYDNRIAQKQIQVKEKMKEYYIRVREELDEVKKSKAQQINQENFKIDLSNSEVFSPPQLAIDKIQQFLEENIQITQSQDEPIQQSLSETIQSEFVQTQKDKTLIQEGTINLADKSDLFDLTSEEVDFVKQNQILENTEETEKKQNTQDKMFPFSLQDQDKQDIIKEDIQQQLSDHSNQEIEEMYNLSDSECIY